MVTRQALMGHMESSWRGIQLCNQQPRTKSAARRENDEVQPHYNEAYTGCLWKASLCGCSSKAQTGI